MYLISDGVSMVPNPGSKIDRLCRRMHYVLIFYPLEATFGARVSKLKCKYESPVSLLYSL